MLTSLIHLIIIFILVCFSHFVASCATQANCTSKRLKNEESNSDEVVNDDGLIKRIRLDSSDKEKNIQLEMERTVSF